MDVSRIPKGVDYKKVQNLINSTAPNEGKAVELKAAPTPRRVATPRERKHIGSQLDVNA